MSQGRDDGRWWTDLALCGVLVSTAAAAMVIPGVPEPVRWVLGLPFLVFLPGYAFVAALLPGAPDDAGGRSPNRAPRSPGWPVRFGLAVAASVVVVAVVGIGLSATVGIRLAPAAVGVAAVSLAFVLVAAVRRLAYPPAGRANPLGGPGDATLTLGHTALQTAAMIVALAALVSAVAFAGAVPADGESYTEFYVLSPDEEGNLTAADVSETIAVGEDQPLHFGIENEEGQTMSYDVVVRSGGGGPDEGTELDRFETRVGAGERVIVEREISQPSTGPTRVQALLYKGNVPDTPSAENADVSLRLWYDGVEGGDP